MKKGGVGRVREKEDEGRLKKNTWKKGRKRENGRKGTEKGRKQERQLFKAVIVFLVLKKYHDL